MKTFKHLKTYFSQNLLSNLIRVTLVFLFFGFALVFSPTVSAVQIACNAREEFWSKLSKVFESLDVTKTVGNMAMSTLTDVPLYVVFHAKTDDLNYCATRLSGESNGAISGDSTCTDGIPSEKVQYCDNFMNSYKTSNGANILYANGENFSKSRISGSLMGFALAVNAAVQEPLPVNMAYYFNDQLSRVPFVGSALAQPVVTYTAPFLDVILIVWRMFRNLAYGLIALFMLVIGIMIITRKKINQQAVVTAQYALPKVIIALILITFSYPIGAFMAQFGYTLMANGSRLVTTAPGFGAPGNAIGANHDLLGYWETSAVMLYGDGGGGSIDFGKLMLVFWTSGIISLGYGVISIVLVLLTLIILLIGWIILGLVILFTYLKMIMHIIGSPLVFALGSLPGASTENLTEDWFKKMVAYMVSLPAMTIIVAIATQITNTLNLAALTSNQPTAFYGGYLVSLIAGPFITLAGFFFASQMPGKVEGWLVAAPKKR